MKILIDVMGSDLGPAELLRGVVAATKRFDASLTAVGPREEIEKTAKENGIDLSGIGILDATDVITMEDKPMSVIREKNHSSMANGLRALAHGEADAFVSAGNTGALITGGTMIVRRIRGVSRAAIGTLFPFSAPVLLLDSGANLDVTPDHLEQFAFIGSLYMRKMFGIESPRVGLLNNGTEETKGNQLQIDTYKKLTEMDGINFVGNVEAKAIPFGVCDVVVTDGFTGNLFLKTVEGMAKYMSRNLKDIFHSTLLTKLSGFLIHKRFAEFKEAFSATKHGGAPILGLRAPVIKAHGSSNARAIASAVGQAIRFAEGNFNEEIEAFFASSPGEETGAEN
ncbi:MAG: phosphate acyltransferase PlsX [Clostridia bacterium]|nr:phosphate acyltransferase PlsX [Clostridia bacterium]